jgi:hypothetical protein
MLGIAAITVASYFITSSVNNEDPFFEQGAESKLILNTNPFLTDWDIDFKKRFGDIENAREQRKRPKIGKRRGSNKSNRVHRVKSYSTVKIS